jgi:3-hydroxymyristoyl/3-hydroxydecanoyl-(acyl carrier protein) dehydratase
MNIRQVCIAHLTNNGITEQVYQNREPKNPVLPYIVMSETKAQNLGDQTNSNGNTNHKVHNVTFRIEGNQSNPQQIIALTDSVEGAFTSKPQGLTIGLKNAQFILNRTGYDDKNKFNGVVNLLITIDILV